MGGETNGAAVAHAVNNADVGRHCQDPAPSDEPTLEDRVSHLEGLVKAQTWFIDELMTAVKALITHQVMEKMQPQMEAQLRAGLAAKLQTGLNI